eukprot:m.91365 g.91365  ORF g.91365 m.91365 type:complete len:693 (-) comp9899_c0_seq2:1199-3277(-)
MAQLPTPRSAPQVSWADAADAALPGHRTVIDTLVCWAGHACLVRTTTRHSSDTTATHPGHGTHTDTHRHASGKAVTLHHASTLLSYGSCSPPRGATLVGPSGVGKTALMEVLGDTAPMDVHRLDAETVYRHDDPVGYMNRVFDRAIHDPSRPSLLLVDQLDTLCPTIGTSGDAASTVEFALVQTMCRRLDALAHSRPHPRMVPEPDAASAADGSSDGLSSHKDGHRILSARSSPPRVFVLAATARPDAVHPSVCRMDRLGLKVFMTVPTKAGRVLILNKLIKLSNLHPKPNPNPIPNPCAADLHGGDESKETVADNTRPFSSTDPSHRSPTPHDSPEEAKGSGTTITSQHNLVHDVAEATPGCCAADLASVCRDAAVRAVHAYDRAMVGGEDKGGPHITTLMPQSPGREHYMAAAEAMTPAHLADVPKNLLRPLSFDSLAGVDHVIERLKAFADLCFTRSDQCKSVGVAPPRGLLLHGPTGVGKTSLALAVASWCHVNTIPLQAASVRAKVVGQAEAALSDMFAKAKQCQPCVLVVDQLEALAAVSDTSNTYGSSQQRIIACLTAEIDRCVADADAVMMIGTCTSITDLDPALYRPGRLDMHIAVPLPDAAARTAIVTHKLRAMPAAHHLVDSPTVVAKVVAATEGGTGADIDNICREAAIRGLREDMQMLQLSERHVDAAVQRQVLRAPSK